MPPKTNHTENNEEEEVKLPGVELHGAAARRFMQLLPWLLLVGALGASSYWYMTRLENLMDNQGQAIAKISSKLDGLGRSNKRQYMTLRNRVQSLAEATCVHNGGELERLERTWQRQDEEVERQDREDLSTLDPEALSTMARLKHDQARLEAIRDNQ